MKFKLFAYTYTVITILFFWRNLIDKNTRYYMQINSTISKPINALQDQSSDG